MASKRHVFTAPSLPEPLPLHPHPTYPPACTLPQEIRPMFSPLLLPNTHTPRHRRGGSGATHRWYWPAHTHTHSTGSPAIVHAGRRKKSSDYCVFTRSRDRQRHLSQPIEVEEAVCTWRVASFHRRAELVSPSWP